MKKVKVKDIGVQVNGISHFKNDTFEVTEEEYEPIKEYVDVLVEDKAIDSKATNDRVIVIKVDNEEIDLKEVEKYLYDCLENFGKNPVIEQSNETDNINDEKNSGEGKDNENDNENDDENDNENDDEELNELREKAKNLGIKNAHSMKKETLIKKISETENENE